MKLEKFSPEVLRAHQGISFTGISAIFFCYDGKGRIFLAKRSKNGRDEHGTWAPGAGGHNHGEALEDTVRRELKEEFGAESLSIAFIGYFDVFRKLADGTPTSWLAMTFAVLIDPQAMHSNEPDMFDASDWFSLDNLPSPLHSQFDLFLHLHGDRLKDIMAHG